MRLLNEMEISNVLKNDLSMVDRDIKGSLLYTLANNCLGEFDIFFELEFDRNKKFKDGVATNHNHKYSASISEYNKDFENPVELYLVLYEMFHELHHTKVFYECDNGIDKKTNEKYIPELVIQMIYPEMYKQNHDYFLLEIDANKFGIERAYNILSSYYDSEFLNNYGITNRKNSMLNRQNYLLENHMFSAKENDEYDSFTLNGTYEENINNLVSICANKSPVIEDMIKFKMETFNNEVKK